MLSSFLCKIHRMTSLRLLNIGYNSPGSKKQIVNEDQNEKSLELSIADFLHYSETLLHFDMSGLGLPFDSYKLIAERGIRKSRTLIAIHMSGMGL